MNNIFIEKNITEIHSDFINGLITPIDLAKECSEQYNSLNNIYFPWTSFNDEILFHQADEILKNKNWGKSLRKLEGVPVGIKDIINTIDFPTQMGSPIWKNFTPGNDARCVYNIKNNGGIIPGKTCTAEFAVHTLNETLNPHDVLVTPGTSSSGSAVAIALGMVPVTIGTQTAGSIIRPASFCGVYGCKPSFGLIPRTGMLKTTDSLDTVGFFTIHYKDIKSVFEVLRVHGPNYPISFNAFKDPQRLGKMKSKPWKVAFCKTNTWDYAESYAKASITDFINRLSFLSDIEIYPLDLPTEFEKSQDIHASIYNKTLSYYFAQEFKNSELVSPIMNNLISIGNNISVEQYNQSLSEQKSLCKLLENLLIDFDIIISLSTAGGAPLRNIEEKPDPALIWTMTHLPVISVPLFISPKGLPYGIQIVSRKYNDYKLLKFTDYLLENELIPNRNNPLLDLLN